MPSEGYLGNNHVIRSSFKFSLFLSPSSLGKGAVEGSEKAIGLLDRFDSTDVYLSCLTAFLFHFYFYFPFYKHACICFSVYFHIRVVMRADVHGRVQFLHNLVVRKDLCATMHPRQTHGFLDVDKEAKSPDTTLPLPPSSIPSPPLPSIPSFPLTQDRFDIQICLARICNQRLPITSGFRLEETQARLNSDEDGDM